MMEEKKVTDYCKHCASKFSKRDYRHVFCSIDCREEFKREIKRKDRLENDVDAKLRDFSDLTITMVASSMIKGENLDVIVKLCNWDRDRFYQQVKLHKYSIDKRIKLIKKRGQKYYQQAKRIIG